jgi:hypothetical protein
VADRRGRRRAHRSAGVAARRAQPHEAGPGGTRT